MESKKSSSSRVSLLINVSLTILSIIIFFGSLELYAKYKYWGESLKQKGFYSRGKSYKPKKQTAVRIVCVGGSTTHGGHVEYNETYPFYLEQIINERVGKGFAEVLNSGLPATPTEHHRDFIKERIADQELDILVLHSLYNHYSSFYPYCYNPKIDKIFIERTSKVRTIYKWNKMNLAEIINIFLMEHSYFYTRLREKILKISKRDLNKYYAEQGKFITGEGMDKPYKAETQEDKKQILTLFNLRYYKAIDDIIIASKSRNVDVVLIIPPYPFFSEEYNMDIADFRPAQYYNTVFESGKKILIELGKRYDLLVVDADSEFLKRGRRANLFHDGVHLTPKGNHILADIIASKLIPHLEKIKNAYMPRP